MNGAQGPGQEQVDDPGRLLESSWEERAKVLNQVGYARYDERTSTMLEQTARLLIERWDGDLRQLRREAEQDPRAERRLLQQFKGIGDVGAYIICREAQTIWKELRPFADRRAVAIAERIGLPGDPSRLARLAGNDDLSTLVAGLIRLDLDKGYQRVLDAVRG